MPRVVHNLKRFFRKPVDEPPFRPFKQFNSLNYLDSDHLNNLLRFSEQSHLSHVTPEILEKEVLFISYPKMGSLIEAVLKQSPSLFVNYQVNCSNKLTGKHVVSLKGNLNPLGLKPNSFDLLFLPVASIYQKEFTDFFPSMSKMLKNGGRAVFSVIHPALELFLYNQNPSSASRAQTSLQRYFSAFKENDLFLEEIVEGTIDKETESFLQEEEHFEELKGIPLVLFLRVVKYIKK